VANAPWVIGGHRGRLYADNSAELHQYMVQHTQQPIIWIGNKKVVKELRQKGFAALRRNSLAARKAILNAPVLLYSHGEDDLDLLMIFARKRVRGIRIYLNHSMNFIKAGQFMRPKLRFPWLVTQFDYLLACSPAEKLNFDKSFPHCTKKILPEGGGAHIDKILRAREVPQKNLIVWFPTFRENLVEQGQANDLVRRVCDSTELKNYLEKEKLELAVVGHINAGSAATHGPGELLPLLAQARCFISDYSGTLIDWLLFERPVVFFPFDQKEYLKTRRLYTQLEDLSYGPLVRTPEDFLEVLTSGVWQDMEPWQGRRKYWTERVFPNPHYGFAQRCYEKICEIKKALENGGGTKEKGGHGDPPLPE
jgi:hypothetical protein